MQKKYAVVSRETDDIIDFCENEEEAYQLIENYEEEDLIDKIYTPNFYAVKELSFK